MQMSVDERPDGVLLVRLTGSLDLAGTNQIDMRFHGAVAPRRMPTVVDLSAVDFMSSLGMGMFVACASSLRRAGKKMAFLNAKPAVAEAIRHSRIDMVIPLFDKSEQAIEAVNHATK